MAAPNLAARNMFFVNYVGTDDAGYNTIGAPQPYRSITAALAALALVANPPSVTNPWTIAVGPGVFVEAGLILPPWVWIVGSADGDTPNATTISLSGDVTLATSWNLNTTARGGFSNLIFRAASGTRILDFTLPVPVAGAPFRSVEIAAITTDLGINCEGTSSIVLRDKFLFNGCNLDGANSLTAAGGTVLVFGTTITSGSLNLANTASLGLTALLFHSYFNALAVTRTAQTVTITIDAVSRPDVLNTAFTGTISLNYANDAYALGYTPSESANWATLPENVQEALDILAGNGGGGGIANIPSAAGVAIDFTLPNQQINPLNNDVTFSSLNLAAGRSVNFRMLCGGAGKNLTFPGGWKFVGAAAPANIAAGKNARFTAESWGTTDANVIVAYAVEP